MDYRMIRMLLFVVLLGGVSADSEVVARRSVSTHSSESTLYVYLNRSETWCALKSRSAFTAEVKSDKTSQFVADQAQVWLKGKRLERITEFRMDADEEWSTTSTYSLNANADVVSADVVVRSGDPPSDTTLTFIVMRGAYRPTPPSFLSPERFRKAITLSSFSYEGLVEKLASSKTANKLCQ